MANPARFPTRTRLIEYAIKTAPSRACVRAIKAGSVSVLGGFSSIEPLGLPGWICQVRSRHGRIWLLGVFALEESHSYRTMMIEEVPWDRWVGKVGRTQWSVYDGDHPQEADRERRKSIVLARLAMLRRSKSNRRDTGDEE